MQPVSDRAEAQLEAGVTLVGRYRLTRPLGEGGMGYVWEGRQITTDKPVAIKILKGTNDADAARFLREARLSAALSHRNIVQVFDFWGAEGDGPIFMVMELLRGETLGAYLARVGRLSIEETRVIGLAVASAMRAAHAVGVVHRDLKPENVYLVHNGEDAPGIKVLDFGIARATFIDAELTAVTRTGSVIGTPHYMAPEQIFGEKDIDGRADVWALGIILYECLSGVRPFDGENLGQIFRKVTQGHVAPLTEMVPEVPPSLSALILSMLSIERAQRPTSAEIHEALSSPTALGSAPPQQVQFTQLLVAPPRSSFVGPVVTPSQPPLVTPHGVPSSMVRTNPPSAVSGASPPLQTSKKTAVVLAVSLTTLAMLGVGVAVFSKTSRSDPPAVDLESRALPTASAPSAPSTTTVLLPASPTFASSATDAPEAAPSAPASTTSPAPQKLPVAATTGAEARPSPRAEPRTQGSKPASTAAPTTSDPLSGGRF